MLLYNAPAHPTPRFVVFVLVYNGPIISSALNAAVWRGIVECVDTPGALFFRGRYWHCSCFFFFVLYICCNIYIQQYLSSLTMDASSQTVMTVLLFLVNRPYLLGILPVSISLSQHRVLTLFWLTTSKYSPSLAVLKSCFWMFKFV